MRTVLLVAPYVPPHAGGVEQYVRQLTRFLRQVGDHRVVVVTTTASRVDGRPLRELEGAPVRELPVDRVLWSTPVGRRWIASLRRIIDEEGASLVNGHAPVPLLADAAAVACGDDVPFVLTYHTGRGATGRALHDGVSSIYERTLLSRTARRADQVVCSSDYVRADLAAAFAGRGTTITPGVDTSVFSPGGVPDGSRVLFVGSLSRSARYKGLPDLIEAVRQLLPEFPGLHLDVVGDGNDREVHERRCADLGVAGAVTFRGPLQGARLTEAYRQAAVVCLPTHFESFGMVLAEAMACGRPVVSTTVGGVPSVVDDGVSGLLVPPRAPQQLAAALARVLRDPDSAAALGRAGWARVHRDLTVQHQVRRTVQVFDEAVAVRSSRRRQSAAQPSG